MTNYNDIYASSENALGAPYDVLIEGISKHVPSKARILDVGCGQGRDALPLARMGYQVTAIDAAPAGIASLQYAANNEDLDIDAKIADVLNWTPNESFDVLLCNRILHMISNEDRLKVFATFVDAVAKAGFVFLVDERSNMNSLKETIARTGRSFKVLHDTKGDYFVQLDQREH